ncbi:MAG: hypothetical protein JWL97_3570 [Gemmatimonadales bacterium]|nr:hypothetical protein [Gemmatimonadales bacterium]
MAARIPPSTRLRKRTQLRRQTTRKGVGTRWGVVATHVLVQTFCTPSRRPEDGPHAPPTRRPPGTPADAHVPVGLGSRSAGAQAGGQGPRLTHKVTGRWSGWNVLRCGRSRGCLRRGRSGSGMTRIVPVGGWLRWKPVRPARHRPRQAKQTTGGAATAWRPTCMTCSEAAAPPAARSPRRGGSTADGKASLKDCYGGVEYRSQHETHSRYCDCSE